MQKMIQVPLFYPVNLSIQSKFGGMWTRKALTTATINTVSVAIGDSFFICSSNQFKFFCYH